MEELTLEEFCKRVSNALEAEGHKDVHSDVKGDIGVVVSDRTEFEITRTEDESQIYYYLVCTREGRSIDDAVYDYIADIKSSSFNFRSGYPQKIMLGIGKESKNL